MSATAASTIRPGHTNRGPDMAVRGYTMEKAELLTRLRKIEGQTRGLQRMVDDDA